ncbi:MAG: type II secretion system GspH family protein [Puniceicoccales bacterium]|jgi:prepilin-type N-terminal cleavage/methylation domain-containing protein|nr:type II secretion system GspH family protein [Puniceicoccales bacterium]
MKNKDADRKKRGFTVVEILVALMIAAMVVAVLARGIVSGRDQARLQLARIDMEGRVKRAIVTAVMSGSKEMTNTTPATQVIAPAKQDITTSELIQLLNTANHNVDLKDPWGDLYDVTSAAIGGVTEIFINAGATGTAAGVAPVKFKVSDYIN